MARKTFSIVTCMVIKLWVSKFIELDVCGRPLFENPVTYLSGSYCPRILLISIHLWYFAATQQTKKLYVLLVLECAQ